MDSVEFGTRRQEFGAQLLQCSANDFSLKVLSCGDGGHDHIWIFFCDANPPITLLLTFRPGFKFPESDFLIFCSVASSMFPIITKYLLQEKIELTFCWPRHFLCVDPWPEPQMFYTTLCCVLPKLCFTKPVFCQYPGHCFVSASDNVLSLGFVQIKTTLGRCWCCRPNLSFGA